MAALWTFSAGPQLYYRYKQNGTPGVAYVENKMEAYSSRTINCLRASWNFCYYFSPLLMVVLYRRGTFSGPDGPPYLAKVISVALGVYYLAHITRGVGRMSNSTYKLFTAELKQVQQGQLPKSVAEKYDFEFSHWPVNYSLLNTRSRPVTRVNSSSSLPLADRIKLLPARLLSYVAASSFARWLLYPGSTGLLNSMIQPALVEGRTKLIHNHKGKRHKLETYEGNHLDTIFIDKRHDGTEAGNILVIVSEGNAAFYEAGCIDAPLSRGYSILGWNHPGFGSSTGTPHPEQEHNAMDTVIQFAINKLNFPIEQIVFFSWSIGGFDSTWAAANYPECKAVILDATFDDVLPLAKNRMPLWMGGLVDMTVRDYFNLNIAEWLSKYNGPVKLIRRTQDEMIATDPADVRTNRGNFLLLKLLSRRYPSILNAEAQAVVTRYLSRTEESREAFIAENNIDEAECHSTLLKLSQERDTAIPMTAGDDLEQEFKNQLAVFLAEKHMVDLVSTHCVPLPADLFELPWQLE